MNLQRIGERISSAVTGCDCTLPDAYGSSSYGLSMEDLARLLSQWQERAFSRQCQWSPAAAYWRLLSIAFISSRTGSGSAPAASLPGGLSRWSTTAMRVT